MTAHGNNCYVLGSRIVLHCPMTYAIVGDTDPFYQHKMEGGSILLYPSNSTFDSDWIVYMEDLIVGAFVVVA
eukprot:9471402-Ditylum_brightwellii.AAC.1